MKVLLVFPQADKQTGVFIKDAFLYHKCEVDVVDSKLRPQDMVPRAKVFSPDLLLCARTPALLEGMREIRVRYPKIKTVCWNTDVRNNVRQFGGTLLELFNSVHIFYTMAKGNILDYKKHCPTCIIKHLQEAADPRVHNRFELTEEDIKKHSCDVLFAGTVDDLHEGRRELIRYLEKQDFHFRLITNRNYLLNEDHSKACQCAKIVIGSSGMPKISLSMSARDYRVMGAGGFLLTNHILDIEKWFRIGLDCETYKTKEECVEKIKFYLQDWEARQIIAEDGYRTVHAKHLFKHRIAQILNDVKEL